MNYDRIQELRAELAAERISYGELAEIDLAFAEIPDSELREARENAMASDMLDELEAHLNNRTYRVTWEIDVWADSPEAAAREALRIQRKVDSIATVFEVESGKETVRIDITEIDELSAGLI